MDEELENIEVKKKVGRPKGVKNRPDSLKPGPKKQVSTSVRQYLEALSDSGRKIIGAKAQILELMTTGRAMNVTAAAKILGLNPATCKFWLQKDEDFKDLVDLAKETIGDVLEDDLAHDKNFIPRMMILKGLKPEYKDKYQIGLPDNKLERFLEKLIELARSPAIPSLPPPSEPAINLEPSEIFDANQGIKELNG